MLFYAQQVDKKNETPGYSVILDTSSLQDTLALAKLLGAPEGDISSGNPASMLRFDYIPDSYFGLREGSWYDLKDEFWDGWGYQAIDPQGPGSVFLRAELSPPNPTINFSNHLAKQMFLAQETVIQPKTLEASATALSNAVSTAELSVFNCGHGNWNEIRTGTSRIMYDVGACRSYTQEQVENLVQSQRISASAHDVEIYISHWDVDHYQSLLKFSKDDFKRISEIVAPSRLPNTATCQRVIENLDKHNVPIRLIDFAPRVSTSRVIELIEVQKIGALTIFRATPGRSRNQGGIVISYEGSTKVALLVGDHHYEKILAAAQNYLPKNKSCVLVTPHHGGNAGSIDTGAWQAQFPSFEIAISCGVNNWDHPLDDNVKGLELLQGGLTPWRTDHRGTWTIAL